MLISQISRCWKAYFSTSDRVRLASSLYAKRNIDIDLSFHSWKESKYKCFQKCWTMDRLCNGDNNLCPTLWLKIFLQISSLQCSFKEKVKFEMLPLKSAQSMLLCYYAPLSKGPLTGGQCDCVCVGSGVPTDKLPWWLSSSFKLGSHLQGGPSLWNRGSGLVSNRHKGLSARSKPHRWQLLLGDEKSHPAAEDVDLRDPALPWEPVEAPRGPSWPPYNWCLFHHPAWAFRWALMSWDLGSRGHGGQSACRGR